MAVPVAVAQCTACCAWTAGVNKSYKAISIHSWLSSTWQVSRKGPGCRAAADRGLTAFQNGRLPAELLLVACALLGL